MCGIAGFVDYKNRNSKSNIESMVYTLKHRGPDDYGAEILKTSETTVGLGHSRLSIIDLSSGGHQPMHYKHLSIVYNGEVYNYKDIKKILIDIGHVFYTKSDTEVILHAYEEWGLKAVEKFIGMFSIVILDNIRNELIFIRDRAGIKPLYYYWNDDLLVFASELKAFHCVNSFNPDISKKALHLFFRLGYIPTPYSIYKHCHKVEAGRIFRFDIKKKEISSTCFWDVETFYKKDKLKISYYEAKDELIRLLESAINYRMISDVPVGIFLSGGYDSSTIAAILQSKRTQKLKTYTIGFEEGNNEAPNAKKVANYLGTDHTELICDVRLVQSIINDLPYYYDEPFADSSAIPTTLVSKLARTQVTVALSADAGDEIFAGYTRYSDLYNETKLLTKIPDSLIKYLKIVSRNISKSVPSELSQLKHKLNGLSRSLNTNRSLQTAALFLNKSSLPESLILSIFNQTPENVCLENLFNPKGFKNETEIAMAIDYKMYLKDDILTKVDRAAMSVSLENREPLLDHRLIELAAQLPIEFKFNGKILKKIFKDISVQFIPKHLLDRPKAGFSLPINEWLKGELSYLIEQYLNKEALQWSGYFNVRYLSDIVDIFKNNRLHYNQVIWRLLIFQMWYFRWMKK